MKARIVAFCDDHFFSDKNLFSYHSDGKGNWIKEGVPVNEFKGCVDVDISITPFTNTLTINRINLSVNEKKQIDVLYVDVLTRLIKPVRQSYKRISETEYKLESVPNDFEAVITVDKSGLVVNYPDLFERNDIQKSNYR